jgi:hypothetical protein
VAVCNARAVVIDPAALKPAGLWDAVGAGVPGAVLCGAAAVGAGAMVALGAVVGEGGLDVTPGQPCPEQATVETTTDAISPRPIARPIRRRRPRMRLRSAEAGAGADGCVPRKRLCISTPSRLGADREP